MDVREPLLVHWNSLSHETGWAFVALASRLQNTFIKRFIVPSFHHAVFLAHTFFWSEFIRLCSYVFLLCRKVWL